MRRVGVGIPLECCEVIDLAISPTGNEARRLLGLCILGEALEDATGLVELQGQVKVTDNSNDQGLIECGAKLVLTGY